MLICLTAVGVNLDYVEIGSIGEQPVVFWLCNVMTIMRRYCCDCIDVDN